MKVPKDYYDELFPFQGQWDMPSMCGLKIRHHEERTYVIVTELYQENPGTSITYAGRALAEQVCKAKGLDISQITYIECAPDTNSKLSFYDEEYFEVDFNADPQHKYRQLPAEEIKSILEA